MWTGTPILVLLAALLGRDAQELNREQMRADLEQLARDVRSEWSYFDDHSEHFGVELDARVAAACETLDDSATPDEFELLLRPIVAELYDGHASLEVPGTSPAPERRWPMVLRETPEGVAIERLAQGLTVVANSEDLPAVGDIVLSADGRTLSALTATAERISFGSSPGMRRAAALRRVVQTRASAIAFELESADGTRRTLDLTTVEASDPGLAPPTQLSWSIDEPLPAIARLRIASFAMPDWKAWLEADQAQRDAMLAAVKQDISDQLSALARSQPRALILDVRGNGGGTDVLGIHFAERLLPESFVYFKLSARVEEQWTEPHGYVYGEAKDMLRCVVPVIALIDEDVFSTTDNFLRALAENHPDFTSVGRPTGAGTGAPRVVSELAHSGARLTLCTQRVYGPWGTLTEGRGTQPDVPVFLNRHDLAAGRDTDLAAAYLLLAERGLLDTSR
jgi:hypothetical protein